MTNRCILPINIDLTNKAAFTKNAQSDAVSAVSDQVSTTDDSRSSFDSSLCKIELQNTFRLMYKLTFA